MVLDAGGYVIIQMERHEGEGAADMIVEAANSVEPLFPRLVSEHGEPKGCGEYLFWLKDNRRVYWCAYSKIPMPDNIRAWMPIPMIQEFDPFNAWWESKGGDSLDGKQNARAAWEAALKSKP